MLIKISKIPVGGSEIIYYKRKFTRFIAYYTTKTSSINHWGFQRKTVYRCVWHACMYAWYLLTVQLNITDHFKIV